MQNQLPSKKLIQTTRQRIYNSNYKTDILTNRVQPIDTDDDTHDVDSQIESEADGSQGILTFCLKLDSSKIITTQIILIDKVLVTLPKRS